MAKINFTKKALEELTFSGKRIDVYDTQVKHLVCRVSATAKTFYVVKRANGKILWVKLGTFPVSTIDQARQRALKILNDIEHGINPNDVLAETRKELTFKDVIDHYSAKHLVPHCRPKTVKDVGRIFDLYAKQLFNKRISAITHIELSQLHITIKNNHGEVIANRLIQYTKAALNYCIRSRIISSNLAHGIELFRETARARYLTESELQSFLEALNDEPNETIKDYLFVLLNIGSRKSETLAMQWKHVDLVNKLWTIPTGKNQDIQRYSLPSQVCSILARRKLASTGEYVFASNKSISGHLLEPRKCFDRICARAGIIGVTLHDLRRSKAVYMTRQGHSLQIVGSCLQHKSLSTTKKVYALVMAESALKASQQTSDMMLGGGEVVEFKKVGNKI